ncbi:MAG: GntR family transcriptional regulator [Treponemataceae bacterium]
MLDSINENDQTITAAERVYRILRKKIVLSEFVPGKRLARRKLAEMTGVSQIPVLEAMKRLEQEGLIEYKPRWGCVVATQTPDKVRDLYALREAIECQVVRILAVGISATRLKELADMASEIDRIRESGEAGDQAAEFHNLFHVTMAEYTGCPSLVEPLKRVNLFWLLYKSIGTARRKVTYTPGWHTKLVNSIRTGNPEIAEQTMREHVNGAYQTLMQALVEDGTLD